jgi:hypothetical protein
MAECCRQVVRPMRCPEGKGRTSLLLEYRIERGKMVLRRIDCDNPHLMNYHGGECRWSCLDRISGDR